MSIVPACACLCCGKMLDRADSMVHDNAPKPGDFSLCLECGHLMAFADDLTLRKLTDAEMVEVAGHRGLIAAQQVRAEFLKLHPKGRRSPSNKVRMKSGTRHFSKH